MGTKELFLCIFVGHFIAVQSVIHEQNAIFPQEFPGLFDNIIPSPFKRNLDFSLYDTIFSSWRTRTPEFHMLGELPPIMVVPKVRVFCDESKLTVLVDKRSNGVVFTGEEIQLGYGCYSNGELPNQFVFTYSLDKCGTTRVMQNGLGTFTNSLHLNLKKPPPNFWQTLSTVHISCFPKRSYNNVNFLSSEALPKSSKTFHMKAMNPSWTSTAESNVYKRGQVVNLQVSARTRPEQQLYIQSCFVSASPEPQIKPRHAVIMNKGCTAPLGSTHAVTQFVASNRADVVKLALNTSYLISELYIHCSVLVSDQGVTFGSKSCNYNVIQSRWEDLSGTAEVCECCSSRCKGLSIKHLPEDAKATVSTGPFVIVNKEVAMSPEPPVSEPQETSRLPDTNLMQSDASDGAAPQEMIVSGTSSSKFSSPPQGVVVVSQDPVARLTLWLPGQVQDAQHEDNVGSESEDRLSNAILELQPSNTDRESPLHSRTNTIGDKNLNFLILLDGWVPGEPAIAVEAKRKKWFGRSDMFGAEAPQEVDSPLPAEMTMTVQNQDDFGHRRDEPAKRQADAAVVQDGTNDAQPIVQSKLQLSKGADGSQTLSYEEEVLKQQEGEGVATRFGMDGLKGKQWHGQRGMFSAFLDLVRRIDRAE